jgi:hypothetical protein
MDRFHKEVDEACRKFVFQNEVVCMGVYVTALVCAASLIFIPLVI